MQGDYNIGLICSNVILQTAQNKSDCSFCILFAVSSQLITMMYHRNVYTSIQTQMISAAFAQTRLGLLTLFTRRGVVMSHLT